MARFFNQRTAMLSQPTPKFACLHRLSVTNCGYLVNWQPVQELWRLPPQFIPVIVFRRAFRQGGGTAKRFPSRSTAYGIVALRRGWELGIRTKRHGPILLLP